MGVSTSDGVPFLEVDGDIGQRIFGNRAQHRHIGYTQHFDLDRRGDAELAGRCCAGCDAGHIGRTLGDQHRIAWLNRNDVDRGLSRK